jgi:hypothetical protein
MTPHRQLTAFEKTIPDYRKRILISLAKAFIVPPLLTALALRLLSQSALSLSVYLPLVLLSIPIVIGLRSQYTIWCQDREAARMGAKPITRVCGRWPGNFDVVLRMLKSFESGYVLQGFSDLFEEYGCTTLNTRFFWDDQVSVRPDLIFQIPASPRRTGTTYINTPRYRSSPWTRRSSDSSRTPASPISRRASCGTSGCTSLLTFPAPLSFPLKRAPPFDSDKFLGTGLFNACVLLNASFDCLYAQSSPAKEIGGGSCVVPQPLLLPALHPNSPPLFFPPHVPRAAKSHAHSSQRNASPIFTSLI